MRDKHDKHLHDPPAAAKRITLIENLNLGSPPAAKPDFAGLGARHFPLQ